MSKKKRTTEPAENVIPPAAPFTETFYVKSHSINARVFVTLTEDGVKVLKKRFDQLKPNIKDIPGFNEKIGTWKTELWDVMHVFGSEMYMGGKQMFVGNRIDFIIDPLNYY